MTTLITPLPTPPTRQDSSNFNDRADEFLGALPLFQQEANTLAIEVQASADEVEIARQAVVSTANVTKWISGTTYAQGAAVWSPINGVTYRKMTSSTGGTTDPSLDSVNYKNITDTNVVKDFGAVGDGITNDRDAIVNALTAAAGRDVIFESGKTYLIGSAIVYSGDVSIKSDGADKAIILHNGQAFNPLTVQGTLAATTTLSAAQQINNRGWDVASVSGVQPGMLMEVISSASWYHDPRPEATDARKSELHRVASVSGTTVFTEDPANDGYNVPSETVTVKFYTPVSVRMENIAVRCVLPTPAVDAPAVTGVRVLYANEPVLLDVDVENAANTGIFLSGCYRPVVQRGHTHSANAFTTGYGVQTYGSSHTVVRDRTFWQCRRGVDISGGNIVSRHSLIENCTNSGGGINSEGTVYGWGEGGTVGAPQFGFGSHGAADHTIYKGNRVQNIYSPFYLRGRNEIVENNYIIGRTYDSVITAGFGENLWATGNKVYAGWSVSKLSTVYEGGSNSSTRRARGFLTVSASHSGGTIEVHDNDVQVQDFFLWFTGGSSAVKSGLRASGNKIRFATGTGSSEVWFAYNDGAAAFATDWKLFDNDYRREDGGSGAVTRLRQITVASTTQLAERINSGTYTPTATGVTNITEVTASVCQYMVVGNTVTVSGRVGITPTTSRVSTSFRLSLPVAAPNLSVIQLAGTGQTVLSEMPFSISGDDTNRGALIAGIPTVNSNRFFYFSFTYWIE